MLSKEWLKIDLLYFLLYYICLQTDLCFWFLVSELCGWLELVDLNCQMDLALSCLATSDPSKRAGQYTADSLISVRLELHHSSWRLLRRCVQIKGFCLWQSLAEQDKKRRVFQTQWNRKIDGQTDSLRDQCCSLHLWAVWLLSCLLSGSKSTEMNVATEIIMHFTW